MSLQDEEHIMISYNWENLQEVMIIKEALEEKGYRIGMELRHEEGSIAWAMTEGVDNSSAVLLCVSKAYKDSVNCNKEASYADSRRKNIVPLKLDETVDLDGWISHMVEGRRCYDFYDFKYFKESVDGLDKELVSLGVQKQGNIYSANVGQHKYIGDPDKILKTKETLQEEDVTAVDTLHQRVSEGNSSSKLEKLKESICASICDQNIAFIGPAAHGKSATINTFYQALTGSNAPLAQEFPVLSGGTQKCSRYDVKCKGKTLYFCDTNPITLTVDDLGNALPDIVWKRCQDILTGRAFDEKSFSRRTLEWIGVVSNDTSSRIHCIIYVHKMTAPTIDSAISIVPEVRRMYGNGIPMIVICTHMDIWHGVNIEDVCSELSELAEIDPEYVFTLANYCAIGQKGQEIDHLTTDEHVLAILDIIVEVAKSFKDGENF